MMPPDRLRAMLARMEDAVADTRRNLALAERALSNRAEGETIRLRPKSRHYHRRMSRWTGADEAEYRRVLDRLPLVAGPDLDRLRRKIDRQEGDLSLLKADWSYLNQPAHVAPIVARHQEALALVPTAQDQFGRMDNLPMRPAAPDTAALDALLSSLDAGIDPIEQLIEAN